MKKILILYFSGVGATKKAAQHMRARLAEECAVDICSMEEQNAPDIDMYDAVIVGMPVYHGAPPRAVMRYWDRMPRAARETPAFIYNTRGSHAFNTNRIVSQNLLKKNILTIMDREYRAPASDGAIIAPFIKRFFVFEKCFETKIDCDCADFLALINEPTPRGYIPRFRLGSIINAPNKWAGQLITLRIRLHKSKCVKCGWCVGRCPYSAFSTDDEGFPLYSPKNCENCYRCIHHCPQMALSLRKGKTPEKLLRY